MFLDFIYLFVDYSGFVIFVAIVLRVNVNESIVFVYFMILIRISIRVIVNIVGIVIVD